MTVISPGAWPVVLLFLLALEKNTLAIECYICSWTPDDKYVESDRCSSEHFNEDRVRTESCKVGCEVVKMFDTNGELAMFYRNCLMGTHLEIPFEYKRSSLMIEEELYACDSNYCNGGDTSRRHVTAAILPSVIITLLPLVWSHVA